MTNPEPRQPDRSAAPRSAWYVLALAALGVLVVHAALRNANVPLGCPGKFTYLYSPIAAIRFAAFPWAVLLAGALGLGVWLSGANQAARHWAGFVLLVIASLLLAAWTYCAPPYHYNQHVFTVHSPSHDGAFVTEALKIDSVRDYLRSFPARARVAPEEMRGTRVISNPPGVTLLALGIDRVMQAYPALAGWFTKPLQNAVADPKRFQALQRGTATGLAVLWVLTGLWWLSGVFFYFAARRCLSLPASAACALMCVFTPMTLLFAPGKDVAQLLTVAIPLWLWLVAIRLNRPTGTTSALLRPLFAAIAAGVCFTLALLFSLVHVWIALILIASTLWSAARADRWRICLTALFPAAGAALATALILRPLMGLDLFATLPAVAAAQAEVTRGPEAMPFAWQLLGILLFLLFCGPATWCAGVWFLIVPRVDDRPARFGRALLVLSLVVMLLTVGFTNIETPRLWIPFVPLLVLGGFLSLRFGTDSHTVHVRLLVTLVVVQICCAAVQWSWMDMRESENRLAAQQFFG